MVDLHGEWKSIYEAEPTLNAKTHSRRNWSFVRVTSRPYARVLLCWCKGREGRNLKYSPRLETRISGVVPPPTWDVWSHPREAMSSRCGGGTGAELPRKTVMTVNQRVECDLNVPRLLHSKAVGGYGEQRKRVASLNQAP
jgi:hypothetical protein